MSFDILKVSQKQQFDIFPAGRHRGYVFTNATHHLFITFIWQISSDLSSWILVFIVRRWNILSGSPLGLCLFLLPSLIHVFRQLKHLELTLHVKKHFQNRCPTKKLSSLRHHLTSSVERGHIIWSANVLLHPPALYNRCKFLWWGTAHLWHFSPTKANSVQAANQSERWLHNLIVALQLYIRIIFWSIFCTELHIHCVRALNWMSLLIKWQKLINTVSCHLHFHSSDISFPMSSIRRPVYL